MGLGAVTEKERVDVLLLPAIAMEGDDFAMLIWKEPIIGGGVDEEAAVVGDEAEVAWALSNAS